MSLTRLKTVALLPQLYACVNFPRSTNRLPPRISGHTVWGNDHVSNEANPYLSV